jgi:hypothetical protein
MAHFGMKHDLRGGFGRDERARDSASGEVAKKPRRSGGLVNKSVSPEQKSVREKSLSLFLKARKKNSSQQKQQVSAARRRSESASQPIHPVLTQTVKDGGLAPPPGIVSRQASQPPISSDPRWDETRLVEGCGIPRSRQKEGANMGHGRFVSS